MAKKDGKQVSQWIATPEQYKHLEKKAASHGTAIVGVLRALVVADMETRKDGK